MLAARAFRQAQPGILGGRGFVATQKRAGDARATLRPSWRSETERGRARMSLLTWTVSDGGVHHADFGGGRYSVARTHGRVPRFVARWHRSRGQFTEGKNITGAPTIEAAKAACERHAEQRTDVP